MHIGLSEQGLGDPPLSPFPPSLGRSDPDSAIFMEDTPEDVARKISNA